MSSFSDYLLSKLQEFERQKGKRVSLDDFAEFLGVSRPLVSYWLKGTKPSLENVQLLANKFGPEVYDTLGLPRPNPFIQRLSQIWERIPPDKQQKLMEEAERFEVKDNEQNSKAISKRRKTSTD